MSKKIAGFKRPSFGTGKRSANKSSNTNRANKSVKIDEDISSGSEDLPGCESEEDSDDEFNGESAESKRRRIAKEYLADVKTTVDDDDDDEFDAGVVVADKLQKQRLESKGKLFRSLAPAAEGLAAENIVTKTFSGHSGPITCIALSKDEKTIFSGSKDNSILMWDVESGKRTEIKAKWSRADNGATQSHKGEIMCIALSSDSRYLVSGGRDNVIRVFDKRAQYSEVKVLTGHRDVVSSLAFQSDTHFLFSGSLDRCIKHWDLTEMGYIETLFGHQDGINAMDCFSKTKPLSASSDRSVRIWKVVEQSHLVFRGHKNSIDCIKYLTEDSFLSAGQDGVLHLWKDSQKNPLSSCSAAHGTSEDRQANPLWVTSLATVRMSDLAATGAQDGFVRLWRASAETRSLQCVNKIAVDGFVNSLAVTPTMLVAGTGTEHRLGRWWKAKGIKNKIVVVRFELLASEGEGRDSDSSSNSSGGSDDEKNGDESECVRDGEDSQSDS